MTQKEIANILNVSVATVSLALQNSPRLSDETKARVQHLARMSNYRPNHSARSLLRGRTFSVGIILPQFTNPFYAELTEEIHNFLAERNYMGIFVPTGLSGKELIEGNDRLAVIKRLEAEENLKALEKLLNRGVDGLISKALSLDSAMELKREGVPVVYYSEQPAPVDYVSVDKFKGGEIATFHLIGLGKRCIAFIGNTTGEDKRFMGYRSALEKSGLPLREEWIVPALGYMNFGYEGMKRLLTQRERPEAVLAQNDMAAIGAMRAAREAGLRIPEEMAFVGFDNIEEAAFQQVALTTVEQPRREIARSLVAILLDRIESQAGETDNNSRVEIIEPRLVVRESCGANLLAGKEHE